jgi:hypothetical protein
LANTLTTNPLVINTAATIAVGGTVRPINAKFIEWVGAATVGNTCTIADIGGNVIAQGQCAVVGAAVTLWPGPTKLVLPGKQASFAGAGNPSGSWQVSTIQSGTLYIWF